MTDLMQDRCHQICNGKACLVYNSSYVECIADMVINKVWSIRWIIKLANEETAPEGVKETFTMISEAVDELTEWVNYLRSIQKDLEPVDKQHLVFRQRGGKEYVSMF